MATVKKVEIKEVAKVIKRSIAVTEVMKVVLLVVFEVLEKSLPFISFSSAKRKT